MTKKKIKELTKVEKLQQELKIAIMIEKSNKAFKKMNLTQKRIAIAKDVIESLKSKKFIAEKMIYCQVNTKDNIEIYGENDDYILNKVDLQETICDNSTSCNVCGIGAIFASKVKIADNFNFNELINVDKEKDNELIISDDEEIITNLKDIFSEKQLREIEYAFEGNPKDNKEFFVYSMIYEDNKYVRFHKKYENSHDCMMAIMKNIITNKGVFKP